MFARLLERFPILTRPKAERSEEVSTRNSQSANESTASSSTYVTHAQLNAAVDAIGLALAEAIEAGRDQYFSSQRFHGRLEEMAQRATPAVRRFLTRISESAQGHSHKPYGRNRNTSPGWQPGQNTF